MADRIRRSKNGKLHRVLENSSASLCNASGRPMGMVEFINPESALKKDDSCFCQRCFGDNPKKSIKNLLNIGMIH